MENDDGDDTGSNKGDNSYSFLILLLLLLFMLFLLLLLLLILLLPLMTSSQANETVRNLLPINDGRNLEESVVGDGIDTRGRDGTDGKVDDDDNDDRI